MRQRAFAPVDIASLVFFRIAFGVLMVWQVWTYFANGWIALHWLEPRFLFKYYGFSWVHPWPGNGLYIHWVLLGVLALFVAAGFLYRISAVLFFLSYTYFFLLDQGRYVNHTYLICLFSFLLVFTPAHRAFSIDAWLWPKLRSNTAPAWSLWLLRIQMGVVYFFAGVAKLSSSDWLHGEPLGYFLANLAGFPLVERFFRHEWFAYTASYSALAFDLLIVPLLVWRRTRIAAFCLALIFHLINAFAFKIDIFPPFAIAATTLFFSPSWPRRILSILYPAAGSFRIDNRSLPSPRKQLVVFCLVAVYVLIQLVVPLLRFFDRGGVEWAYMEPSFSWQMMIRRQTFYGRFYINDPNNGRTFRVHPLEYLGYEQMKRMAWRPDMLVQFAHFLASIRLPAGPSPFKVQARLYFSVNGRKPQLFIDPTVDLAAEQRTLGRPRWLLRVDEPLPPYGQHYSANPFAIGFGPD